MLAPTIFLLGATRRRVTCGLAAQLSYEQALNLPSNPIDLEQREGRVHRFKGHAVRKNIAAAHLSGALASEALDPWQAMFDAAEQASPPGSTHITPYWVYTGAAHIERHVWAHPLSRDTTRLHALVKSVTIYRMAFGQPRQDDLLRYLQEKLPQAELERIAALAAIDISPKFKAFRAE